MSTYTTGADVIAAARRLQDERNELLRLLAQVADGYTGTLDDGTTAFVELPADVMAEIAPAVTEAGAPVSRRRALSLLDQ